VCIVFPYKRNGGGPIRSISQKKSNWCRGKLFVKMLATWSLVDTNSVCLARLWETEFWVRKIALWLWHNNVGRSGGRTKFPQQMSDRNDFRCCISPLFDIQIHNWSKIQLVVSWPSKIQVFLRGMSNSLK